MSEDGTDVTKAKTWPQVVAIIAGYAVVQVVLNLKAETAPYSMGALAILGFLAFYIIRTQNAPSGDYVLGNIEGLKEFLSDKKSEKQKTAVQSECDFLDRLCREIQQRITQLERIYKKIKK